jgi:GNAT superfamily N-acetyltransferase
VIEVVEIADLPEVERLIIDCISRSVDASLHEKEAFITNVRKNLQRWSENPDASVHLKYLESGQIIGVVLIRDFWSLCHLFVVPEAQRRGIGQKLIQDAIQRCAGRCPESAIRLNASRNAVSFYKAQGFHILEPASERTFGATPMYILV